MVGQCSTRLMLSRSMATRKPSPSAPIGFLAGTRFLQQDVGFDVEAELAATALDRSDKLARIAVLVPSPRGLSSGMSSSWRYCCSEARISAKDRICSDGVWGSSG